MITTDGTTAIERLGLRLLQEIMRAENLADELTAARAKLAELEEAANAATEEPA